MYGLALSYTESVEDEFKSEGHDIRNAQLVCVGCMLFAYTMH